ncbi:helix-turn-helix domain-containing protein [Aeromicrobium sp. CF3.5]|uniref:helix-turn-helix domain-containing protein n=1 Tax=Aeromicrobium sp. CF3.5 TaxID=3373078 RepID=UPI003EE4D23C
MAIRNTAELGALVKSRRVASGVTQGVLAARAGVSRGFIVRLEQGVPTLEVGRALAVLHALDLAIVTSGERGNTSSDPTSTLDAVFENLGGGGNH